MKTTLNEIKKYSPCTDGWKRLLSYLGKTQADNEPLDYTTILESNGIDDAIWSLRTSEDKKLVRIFAGRCAEHVLHIFEDNYPDDDRPRKAVEIALRGELDTANAANAAVTANAANAAYAAAVAANVAAYAANAAAAAAAAAANAAANAANAAVTANAANAAYAAANTERDWQTNLFKEMFSAK